MSKVILLALFACATFAVRFFAHKILSPVSSAENEDAEQFCIVQSSAGIRVCLWANTVGPHCRNDVLLQLNVLCSQFTMLGSQLRRFMRASTGKRNAYAYACVTSSGRRCGGNQAAPDQTPTVHCNFRFVLCVAVSLCSSPAPPPPYHSLFRCCIPNECMVHHI